MRIDADILKKELGLADDCDNCERLASKFVGCESEAWAIVCDRINQLAEDDLSEWGKERIVESFGQKYVVRDCIKCGWHGAIGKMKYCPNCGRGMVNWNV